MLKAAVSAKWNLFVFMQMTAACIVQKNHILKRILLMKKQKNNFPKKPNSSAFQPRDEFRKNNSSKGLGHPAYIYERVGNNFKFIGITHSPITHGVRNIKLDKNPNPVDDSAAYFRPNSDKAKINKFGKKLPGWGLSSQDKKKINKYKK